LENLHQLAIRIKENYLKLYQKQTSEIKDHLKEIESSQKSLPKITFIQGDILKV